MGSEFSNREANDTPTYAGALTVIRAMVIGVDGSIISPARGTFWSPGENQAECQMTAMERQWRIAFDYRKNAYFTYNVPPERLHRVASLDCSCGFYAYFNEQDAYHYLPRKAISELGMHRVVFDGCYVICSAYGRMTVGDSGLRASKMRIEALIAKNRMEVIPEPKMPIAPRTIPLKWDLAMVFPFLLANLAKNIFDARIWFWLTWLLFPFWLAWAVLTIRDYRRIFKYRKAMKIWSKKWQAWEKNKGMTRVYGQFELDQKSIERIRNKYPDLPIYSSVAEALEKHPLSGPKDL